MKERPILFSGPLVRALLAGTKSQTRRLVNPQPTRTLPNTKTVGELDIVRAQGWRWQQSKTRSLYVSDDSESSFAENLAYSCPHGQPGERLWVREAFDCPPGSERIAEVAYRADYDRDPDGATWRPPIHMPRVLSRIALEITEVRVERLQSISEEDAKAEGVELLPPAFNGAETPYRSSFSSLWDAINGSKAPWSSDPFCWVISFKVCK